MTDIEIADALAFVLRVAFAGPWRQDDVDIRREGIAWFAVVDALLASAEGGE